MSLKPTDLKYKYIVLKNQLGGEWERSKMITSYNIFEDDTAVTVDYRHMDNDDKVVDNMSIGVLCAAPEIRLRFNIFNIAGTSEYGIGFDNNFRGIAEYRSSPEIRNKLSSAILKIMQIVPADRKKRISEKVEEVRQVLEARDIFDAETFIYQHL